MTPDQILLINLLVSNAIREITSRVSAMSEEETKAAITEEEARNKDLMDQVDSHQGDLCG